MHDFPSANCISKLSISKFNSLPKTGKPTPSEWTVLATIVQFDQRTNESKVVALGTGTKCIGQTNMCPMGLILNDSHAEILARRAFLRYIYNKLSIDEGIFSFESESKSYKLREGVSFHFFSSQIPCGDACIVDQSECSPPSKKIRPDSSNEGEIVEPVFTGAKVLESTNGNSDPMHQRIGALRIKPGRGVRTLSLSCSDKISRWNVLGVQGAFLDTLLTEPIYMNTITFSCDYNRESIERAIYKRYSDKHFEHKRFQVQTPEIRKSTQNEFQHSQTDSKQPSPSSLIWSDIPKNQKPLEVAVSGKKQGVTQKNINTKSASLKVCKAQLLDTYCDLLKNNPGLKEKLNIDDPKLDDISYFDLKAKSTVYKNAWTSLREDYFVGWVEKDSSLLNFCSKSN